MYLVTRIWEAKPMEARNAATLAALIGEVYEKAGQRSSIQVSFNGGTLRARQTVSTCGGSPTKSNRHTGATTNYRKKFSNWGRRCGRLRFEAGLSSKSF